MGSEINTQDVTMARYLPLIGTRITYLFVGDQKNNFVEDMKIYKLRERYVIITSVIVWQHTGQDLSFRSYPQSKQHIK